MLLIAYKHSSMAAGRRSAAAWLLALAVLARQHAAAGANLRVQLRVLVLTTPGFANIHFLESVMQGYGTPYDVLALAPGSSASLNLTEQLWAGDGAARYAGIVLYPNVDAIGLLSRAQVEQLAAYQLAARARVLRFGAWGSSVGIAPDLAACSSAAAPMALTPAAPLGASGVKPGAVLDASGLWRCPGLIAQPLAACSMWAADFAASGLHPPCTATPFLNFLPPGSALPAAPAALAAAAASATHTGGVLVNYADGREAMALLFDCSASSTTCMVLGHLGLSWLLRDVIPGARAPLLTIHVDDVLMSSEFSTPLVTADAATGTTTALSSYRATLADLQAHAAWQRQLSGRLPAGSHFAIELEFNGNGVMDAYANKIGSSARAGALVVDGRACHARPEYAALACDRACWFGGAAACPASQAPFCRNCTKGWAKPAGYGTNKVPQNALAAATHWAAAIAADPLAAAVASNAGGLADAFYWASHTFTHMQLDNATNSDSDQQFGLNLQFAGEAYLNLTGRAGFSAGCVVTPEISGLLNGDALAAAASHGVACATGDNTWPVVAADPAAPHHPVWTTAEGNGYDGFAILPRYATEIYYNCSTAGQNEALYNALYGAYYGGDSSIGQIVGREATRVVREALLALRADPYMMHQANLALIDGSGKSLLMRWVEAVVQEFTSFVTWPLTSLKLDDLFASYLAREARDLCHLGYTLEVTPAGDVAAVHVTSDAAAEEGGDGCVAPLLLPVAAGGAAQVQVARGGATTLSVAGLTWGSAAPAAAQV